MPDRDKSIPAVTPAEAQAQQLIGIALGVLDTAKLCLGFAHLGLPDPPDGEEMGEGTVPESLAFSLRGSLEVVLADHVNPAMKTLRRALRETPEGLHRDWLRRQSKRRK